MQEEIWKDVPGYEGIYQVSNFGLVRSLERTKLSGGRIVKVHSAILKGRLTGKLGTQYLAVALHMNGNAKQFKIHQLVAMAFLNHKPCGHAMVVDHINDDKFDNQLKNLQVITQRENSYKTQGKYSSQYKGVSWSTIRKKWRARVRNKGLEIMLGYFDDEIDAKAAYNKYCLTILNI